MSSPAFTCSLGCCGGVLLVGVVEYEKVVLPGKKKKNMQTIKISHNRLDCRVSTIVF